MKQLFEKPYSKTKLKKQMKILLLIILCSASGILYSQIDTVATVTYTEKMPAFPGGQTEM